MELYHSTNQEITKINADSRFGEFLFFGSDDMGHGEHIYKIEIDEDNVIAASSFFYHDDWKKLDGLVKEIQELCECDEDTARNYLDGSLEFRVCDEKTSNISWDIQTFAAKAAKILGYRGVAVSDEHGISWMIDMLNRESELVKI